MMKNRLNRLKRKSAGCTDGVLAVGLKRRRLGWKLMLVMRRDAAMTSAVGLKRRRLGWKFSARKRGMYRRRPRRR
ncbi:MAG: hypothetical protein ACI4WT_10580 [Oligosphaeraceae bacterium]